MEEKKFYKDLNLEGFENNDIELYDEDAVKFSVKNIILTKKGERLSDPNFGTNLYKLLFENISGDTLIDIETEIEYALESYEPRVNLLGVDVQQSNIDENTVIVKVYYEIKQLKKQDYVQVEMNRVI